MTDLGKDPICGMGIDSSRGLSPEYLGKTYLFCSEFCRRTFLAQPEQYLAGPSPPEPEKDPAARHIANFSIEVGQRTIAFDASFFQTHRLRPPAAGSRRSRS